MNILRELDPEGTEMRRSRVLRRRRYTSRGPNNTWHMDGYDKLKPYGLPIHGAIDGFSRKILWLKVCKSNNHPSVPANYYVETVNKLKLIPTLLRTNLGTENGIIAALQCTLWNDINAHLYGSSINNQRIEAWWSILRRTCTNVWINFFKDLIDRDLFDTSNNIHCECIK